MTFEKGDKTMGCSEKVDDEFPFVQLLSVVEENNMYAAWEKGHCTQIVDYKHTDGEPPTNASST